MGTAELLGKPIKVPILWEEYTIPGASCNGNQDKHSDFLFPSMPVSLTENKSSFTLITRPTTYHYHLHHCAKAYTDIRILEVCGMFVT